VAVALPVRGGRALLDPGAGDWCPVIGPELAGISVLERA
jgi:hypothetical protein